jgi:hypothetical protein
MSAIHPRSRLAMKDIGAIAKEPDGESDFGQLEMLSPLQLQSAEDPAVAMGGFLPGLLVGKQIGVGRRCLVFAARCNGTEMVVKRYRSDAVAKHAELADMPLAEFEFRRNQACYSVPGLDRNVARPIGYYVGSGAQWLVQERIEGPCAASPAPVGRSRSGARCAKDCLNWWPLRIRQAFTTSTCTRAMSC